MEHRRFHMHKIENRGDPFSNIENGFSSLTAAAGSMFGFGGGGNAASTTAAVASDTNNGKGNGGGPATANPATSSAHDNGDGGNGGGKGGNNKPSTVYVTATWTGSGSFSLSTVQPDPAPTVAQSDPAPSQQTTADPEPASASDPAPSPSTTLQKSQKSSATQRPSTSLVPAPAATTSLASSAALSVSTAVASSLSIASSSSTAAQAAATTNGALALGSGQSAGGLTGGAKAGIAIGVILAVLALLGGAFALYRWKKNRDENGFESLNSSEKNPFSDAAQTSMAQGKAATPPPIRPTGPAVSANPFGSGATQMAPTSVSMNGFNGNTTAAVAGAAGVAGLAGAVMGNGMARTNPPPQLNVNRSQSPALIAPPVIPGSPAGSTFSNSSTVAAGVAGGVGGVESPRMHRVQMDFNPTMEDELKIAVGEVVRVVREFDDGWCSVEIVQRDGQGKVIRQQQGVVPRTCLSRLPLKPRQRQPAPPGAVPTVSQMTNLTQSMGPPGPGRMQSPSMGPNSNGRSMPSSPYGGSFQERSQNPADRARSNSASDINGRARSAVPGPSRMNPVMQNSYPVELPAQSKSMSAMPNVAPANHDRNLSGGSASGPVSRKPVPGGPDA